MSDLKMFLKPNALGESTRKFVASKRYVDEKGEPIEWEIAPLSANKDEQIRKDATKYVGGKRGAKVPEFDQDKYFAMVCAESTVYPNLNDAELQDSYGVKDAISLLKEMLLPGEYALYREEVLDVNGYDMSMEELVDEAKN